MQRSNLMSLGRDEMPLNFPEFPVESIDQAYIPNEVLANRNIGLNGLVDE